MSQNRGVAQNMSGNVDGGSWTFDWASDLNFLSKDKSTRKEYDNVSQYSEVSQSEQGAGKNYLKQRMTKLFDQQIFTDVIFYQKGNDSISISAHKAVLAVGSPLFEKMLFGEDSTSYTNSKMEVRISNLPFPAFTSIIRYLYTDEVYFESDSSAQDILDGAKEFAIQSLIDKCVRFFEGQPLTAENVCSKLQMSVSNKVDALKQRCIDFIQKNTYRVINSSDFLNSNATTVRTICKLQSLNLRREVDLLEAVITWVNLQPPGVKRQATDSVLKTIRFLTFAANEVSETIQKYPNLLTTEDGLQILMYVSNPVPKASNALPAWCNKSRDNRCCFEEKPAVHHIPRRPEPPRQSRLIIPLKQAFGHRNIPHQLKSVLQMRCKHGYHEIFGLKLSFQPPVSNRSLIKLAIHVHVAPSGFNFRESIEVANSFEVKFPFKFAIFARPNDVVDIEVDADEIKFYNFLQYDDTQAMPVNEHFDCSIGSKPSEGKFFFISEVEYGPRRSNHYRRCR